MSKELNDALDAYANITKIVAEHFGIKTIGYDTVQDMREYPWDSMGNSGTVGWWDLQEEADEFPEEVKYYADVYGTSKWDSGTHTLYYANDGCGNRDALIFDNAKRVDKPKTPIMWDGWD